MTTPKSTRRSPRPESNLHLPLPLLPHGWPVVVVHAGGREELRRSFDSRSRGARVECFDCSLSLGRCEA
ncbi:hypothetical protein [Rathayibacter sp. AY1E1]|uniref:hypothetical protein n=1 Tax=Rathayibacter sp. AY1E1 TaxID=2080549 RepID=UPI000CE863BF|nr:hypothetical protein [Rathayibacter sp. AY1E1]PPH51215.1 hypothetical protein C5C67_11915 [Rathayibacter sp. AY1E1]